MRKISSVVLFILLALISCTKNHDSIVISKYFNNQEWGRFEYLEGVFDVNNVSHKYDVVMEVMLDDSYPNPYEMHQNDCHLLFNLTIKNPDGNGARSKDYKFALKDKDGNWKAEKENGYYVYKLPVIGEMTFGDKGAYAFKLENKYPKDPLYGIKSLTLKCVKSE